MFDKGLVCDALHNPALGLVTTDGITKMHNKFIKYKHIYCIGKVMNTML